MKVKATSALISFAISFPIALLALLPNPQPPEQVVVSEELPLQIVSHLKGFEVKPDRSHLVDRREYDCLARNVFYEAGIEDWQGKIAVMETVNSRLKTKRWGKTYCSVIFHKAQFSWTLDKKKRNGRPSGINWEESKRAVDDYLHGARVKQLEGSLYYYAEYINPPKWVEDTAFLGQVGRHLFYSRAK